MQRIEIMEKVQQERFRLCLKVGDRIDAVKYVNKLEMECWGPAIITFIYQNSIEIKFENDSNRYNRTIDRYSSQIAQLGQYSSKYNWKNDLKVGDHVDAVDDLNYWFASTIIDIEEHVGPNEKSGTLVKIGYRIYASHGTKTDLIERKFFGWSGKYDDWIQLFSPRIDKLYSHVWSKVYFKESKKFIEDIKVEDKDDPQIDDEMNPIYAVLRPNICISNLLVECINHFGSQGGFRKILNMVENKQKFSFDLF